MKSYFMDNIITVTLNPSIDVTLLSDYLDFDRSNRVISERREMGGKGINVSRLVHEFGQQTMCICFAGEENGEELAHFLEQDNLRYEFISVRGSVRENLTIRCVDCKEDPPKSLKLNRKGPAISSMFTTAMMALITQTVDKDDIVVFGGSLPENMDVRDYVELIMATQNLGAKIVIDSDELSLDDYLLIKPWLIKPNIYELNGIIDLKDYSIENVTNAAKTLHAGGVENVLVSMGKDGVLCASDHGITRAIVPKVDVLSTVGAGDATVGGFIVGTTKDYPHQDRVRLAAACGTATTMREATKLATRSMATKIMQQVEIVE